MHKVLLVDHSGRGHAFADLFSRTNLDTIIYYAPGCGAITTERVVSVPELTLTDPRPMAAFAKREEVDFVFVANTMALAAGFVDVFRAHQLAVIGPDQQASRLETSKIYTKQLCARYDIPVADFVTFDNPDDAKAYVRSVPYQIVVKADGLCGGNGSFVCDTAEDAIRAIDKLMIARDFGASGDRVLIERRLFGQELSFFALTDGIHYKLLPMALDYPKSDDSNTGITCGGVGAISPHPMESDELARQAEQQLLSPLMNCIAQEGLNYTGILYIGCVLVDTKLYLLEVNVRMGDPEAEVSLPRIESDFLGVCRAILERTLDSQPLLLNDLYYCDIVATQGRTKQVSGGKNKGWYQGWPYGRYGKYYRISGIDKVDLRACKVFIGEASVHPQKGLVSDGGRVMHVVGFGKTLQEATEHAYNNIKHVHFEGMRYRSDIGRLLPWSHGGTALTTTACVE